MTILLLSRLFPPSNEMGAVRPKNIADYLHAFGHEFICVTDAAECDQDHAPYQVLRINTGRIGQWLYKRNAKKLASASRERSKEDANAEKPSPPATFLHLLKEQIVSVFYIIDEAEWARNAYRALPKEAFDVVITSFGPLSSVLFGRRYKKEHRHTVWISDMRDAMDVDSQPAWRRLLFSRLQRKMARRADVITTVSRAMKKKYEAMNGAPVHTIENGYGHTAEQPSAKPGNPLTICYTGSLYDGLRKMDALFQAIAQLNHRNHRPVDILVGYAGADGGILMQQAAKYGVSEQTETLGTLPREEAMRLQLSSDILCVVSWNTAREQGILTGKYAEYMRLRKPILSIVSGDLPNAELSERIRECGEAGLDYEYAREGDDRRLVDWLERLLRLKRQGEPLPIINQDIAEKYDYEHLMRSFNEIVVNAKTR